MRCFVRGFVQVETAGKDRSVKPKVAKMIGMVSLVGTILPPTLFMLHWMPHGMMQNVMLLSCLGWFATAPFWMKAE